jgi:hypothetical protein
MKYLTAFLAAAALLGLAAPTQAQLPGPRYVKKAVFVRIHWDRSFYEYWGMNRKPKLTVDQINAQLTGYFDEVRADYLNNSALHNIDLILLNDFNRVTGPMATMWRRAARTNSVAPTCWPRCTVACARET